MGTEEHGICSVSPGHTARPPAALTAVTPDDVSTDPLDRVTHARGKSLRDLVRVNGKPLPEYAVAVRDPELGNDKAEFRHLVAPAPKKSVTCSRSFGAV